MECRIREYYKIPASNKIILYAPTFRKNRSLEPYRIDWQSIIPEISRLYDNAGVTVLLRLHPNMINADTSSLMTSPAIIDATKYHDMQELLCISDMLITDYSSSMFDMSVLEKPCILYATDSKEYDRGYYFDFNELPYPLASSNEELTEIIKNFNGVLEFPRAV